MMFLPGLVALVGVALYGAQPRLFPGLEDALLRCQGLGLRV